MKKEILREKLVNALKLLTENDGMLFSMPLEQYSGYDERKLHEVCINHKLSEYLAQLVIPAIGANEKLFTDIEFNREGTNFKTVKIGEETLTVRPDIIIHNRKPGEAKFNFLIVECKKEGATADELSLDCDKIHALMTDEKYKYHFGLQVLYGSNSVKGVLFYHTEEGVQAEEIA